MFPPPHSGARDTVPGLAINLALGGCLLIAVLAVATLLLCNHKHRMQTAPTSSTRGPQQVDATLAQPDSQKSEEMHQDLRHPGINVRRAKENRRGAWGAVFCGGWWGTGLGGFGSGPARGRCVLCVLFVCMHA